MCTGFHNRGRSSDGCRLRHLCGSRAQALAHARRNHDQLCEPDPERHGPRLGAEDQYRDQDQRAEADQSPEARGPEWCSALQHSLDDVAVERTQEHTRGETDAKAEMSGQCRGHDNGRRQNCAADRRQLEHAAGPHLESSLTFNQMPAAPATRPTNSPTRTKTGAVFSALSSATPPTIGSRTAAGSKIPNADISGP